MMPPAIVVEGKEITLSEAESQGMKLVLFTFAPI